MEFVSPIITPVVKLLLVHVKRHLGFLFSSTTYDSDMRVKLSELNSTATDMKRRQEHNNENTLMVPDGVPSWLEEAHQVIIDNEGDTILAGGNGCLDMKKRYKAGKHCFNVIERIDHLIKEKSNMEWTNEQIPLGRVDSATPQVPQDVTQNIFGSRKEIFQRALQLLEADDTTQMVALCGMGGIGKTTMMEELKKVVENRKLFDRVVRVVIGNSTDPIAFQDKIAEYIGEKLSESTRETKADRLEKRFLGMSQNGKKKILIILDDLWNIVDLKDIGLASPLPKGFKLFLTSRNETLCRQMGVETSSILRMVGLEEAEAKQLFWETKGLSDGAGDQEMHKLGEDIVMRCGGLPVAIKTIASALTGQIKDAWRVTLSRLRRHDLQDLQGHYDVVHEIFEISYDYLKNDDYKEIFILSGLFPDDFDIPLEDLMRYGWGLKLFDRVYSVAEARQRTNTSVHNLIRANLLVESDEIRCVKMHDLARSFVLSNISKFKEASIVNHSDKSEWPKEDTRESCERFLLNCKGLSEFPRQFDYPDLKLLKLMMNDYKKKPLKFPDDFYARTKQLQVISYHGIGYPSLVPISLECSTSLRVLCLRSCSLIDDLSSIGQLSNLEILSFAYCGIKNLPSAVGNLKNLKLLDLTGCDKLCIGDDVFQKLNNLEELYMRNLGDKVISFTEDNCKGLEMVSKKLTALEVEFFNNNIRPDRVSFKNLERFRISIGCQLDRIYQYDDDEYSYENTLRLVASCEEVRASGINELFDKTEQLYLQVEDMNHLEDVLMHPSDQYSFCNLKHLSIENCANLKYLFTVNVASTLTNLESLTVSSCDVLGSLIHDENNGAEVIKFHKLKLLVLKELPVFVGLCDNINIVMELPQLVELILLSLPNITCIFASSNNISATTIPLLNKQVVCPKLEELKICGMKNLKEIWAGEEEYNQLITCIFASSNNISATTIPLLNNGAEVIKFLKLKRLELYDLPMFVGLCDNINIVMELPQLVRIILDDLPNITCIFASSNNISATTIPLLNKEVVCPKLETLEISGMEKLKEIWACEEEYDRTPVLKEIEVDECDEIQNLFPRNPMRLLSHLEKLDVRNCGSIQALFDIDSECVGQVNSSLSSIEAWGLGKLREVWRIRGEGNSGLYVRDFQALEYVEIKKCKNFRNIVTPTTIKFDMGALATVIDSSGDKWGRNNRSVEFIQEEFSVPWSLGQYSRKITIKRCHAFPTVIPSYAAEQLQKIEALIIDDCGSMMEVFETKELENCSVFSQASGGRDDTTLAAIPRLKSITMHKLPNLKTLHIQKCHQLVDIFTFSTLVSLVLLENLSIQDCKQLKVIVREEHGEKTTTTSKAVIFPCLKSIYLADLPNLKGFFFGMNEFQLPLLDEVIINRCPQMMVFTPLPLIAPKLKYIRINGGKYCTPECCSFFTTTLPQTPSQSSDNTSSSTTISEEFLSYSHSLIEMLNVRDDQERKEIFSYDELPQLQNLEKLDARNCESVLDVFDVGTGVGCSNSSQTVLKLPKLSDVNLRFLERLKYIWKSNGRTILEFPNLTKLVILGCPQLKHVFTSSMVGSLSQLKELIIESCQGMEVIVKEDQEKEEEGGDGQVNEIRLPCLKSLRLYNLESLKGFCLGNVDYSLPSLESMRIEGCKSLTIFTKGRWCVPKLKVIVTSLGDINLEEEQDINSLIINSFMIEMNLGFDQERQVIFSYDELLQLQNLEKLHAFHCESVLEVFDVGTGVGCSNSSQTVVKLPKLSDVDLWALKSLKYIWKSNGRTILEFPNLTKLLIYGCNQLEHVFTSSMVGSLSQLKELSIDWCQGMEVIVKEDQEEEGGDGKVNEIKLPCLEYIELYNLESLKGFCLGNVDYSLPSLKYMGINECKSLTIFTKGCWCVSKLKVIYTSLGNINLAEEQDINSFIITKRQEGFHFGRQH